MFILKTRENKLLGIMDHRGTTKEQLDAAREIVAQRNNLNVKDVILRFHKPNKGEM